MGWQKRCLGVIGVAVIAFLNGWHLVPVQTFGWATMAIEKMDSNRSFTAALGKAIDTESKCQICHFVEEQNCGSEEINLLDTLPKLPICLPSYSQATLTPPAIWTSIAC
ncbi:MAG TPA: hypothetical protein DIV79_12370 [Opitutae bacterium]|nr:hypothetical protein [Opitutaceae bacterium]HCR30801.1 hypothetical protein [Opitutae bacterium]